MEKALTKKQTGAVDFSAGIGFESDEEFYGAKPTGEDFKISKLKVGRILVSRFTWIPIFSAAALTYFKVEYSAANDTGSPLGISTGLITTTIGIFFGNENKFNGLRLVKLKLIWIPRIIY